MKDEAMTTEAAFTDTATDTVTALACSPEFVQDGLCFAARGAGLYCSADGGATWRAAYESLALAAPLSATAVALSPAFGRDRTVFAGASGGVLRSADAGNTWEVITLPEPAPLVTALAVSPNFAHDRIMFAGTMEDGVFRSEDGGRSWAAWNFGLLDHSVLSLAVSPNFAQDHTVYAGTDSGLFRSTNSGRSWRALVLPAEFAPVLSLAAGSNVLLAGTESDGLLCSCDGGSSWQTLGALDGAINAIVPAAGFPAPPELVVLLNDAPLLSRDGGEHWEPWPGAPARGVSALAVPGEPGASALLLAGLVTGSVARC